MRIYDTGTGPQREPEPDHAEAQHAARVREHIAAAVRGAGGWIGFERYMELALYAPGLGYYSAGARKLGAGGDFTTAPETSRLFGACLAQQCAEVLIEAHRGSILEIGAGSGRLAGDLLEFLEAAGTPPRRYLILEVSADLRERQRAHLQARLPRFAGIVEWLEAPPPDGIDGVILANEVLDALPVTRFRWDGAALEELGVGLGDGGFAWSARPAGAVLDAHCRVLRAAAGSAWPDGYESEYCPRVAPWTAAVTGALREGAVLWFDYGLPRAHYYLPQRDQGTLLCHYRHRVLDDPFVRPGLQDISAWVDFTALAEAGSAAGFEVAGYTTQAYFLAGTGIDAHLRELAGADAHRAARLGNEARRLMLPGEMGERFKVMAWTRGFDRPLSGFALRDLRHTL
ncbi:MAG TPA: SAM-dependent methyltransferase [Steroidobacteraceae bacterium]|nr:SAM-dependent methyltransferase [Steroidobacteraceae bacterium]